MNCQKCNSPLNEGDKFCQVCGSVVEHTAPAQAQEQTPAVEATPEVAPVEPVPVPAPEVAAAPVQPTDVPMMAQPAPMPGPVPMAPPVQPPVQQPMPMNPIPAEPAKKNNTIVIILGLVIGALIIAIVVLLFTGGSGEEKDGGSTNTGNTNTGTTETEKEEEDDEEDQPTQVDTSTKTIVNEFTFILPEGYNASLDEDTVVVYDDNNQVQATAEVINALLSQVSADKVKSNMEGIGITGVTYKSYTKNNKQMLIFTGKYQNYTVEFIYLNYETGKLIGSCTMYAAYDAHKETIYDILTKATVSANGYSNNASIPVPGLTLEDAIK